MASKAVVTIVVSQDSNTIKWGPLWPKGKLQNQIRRFKERDKEVPDSKCQQPNPSSVPKQIAFALSKKIPCMLPTTLLLSIGSCCNCSIYIWAIYIWAIYMGNIYMLQFGENALLDEMLPRGWGQRCWRQGPHLTIRIGIWILPSDTIRG